MEFSKILLFFFFFYIFTIKASSADDCFPMFGDCQVRYQPFIQFPFSIDYYGRCAYPGFNVSCNFETDSMSIQIGSWGEFSVKHVDYLQQKVEIYDLHNCLPKRLLSIDLSGSPFRGAHYTNFTFYNCSSHFSLNVSKPIRCLSEKTHKVYASSNSSTMETFSTCDVIASIMVPSPLSYRNDEIYNDLHLVWDKPDCKECIGQKHGDCGLKNTESMDIKCFLPEQKQGISTSRKLKIGFGIAIPILLFVVILTCCITGKRRSSDARNIRRTRSFPTIMLQPIISMVGLDESVIQSYPKTVLGESGRLAKSEDNTCSICLSEYQAKETLKTIPDCKHCFHATCIDEWLRKNVTCPICRHAPLPSPLPL